MYTGYQKRMCDEAAQRSDLQVRLVSTRRRRGLDAMKADQAVVAVWSCGRVVVWSCNKTFALSVAAVASSAANKCSTRSDAKVMSCGVAI